MTGPLRWKSENHNFVTGKTDQFHLFFSSVTLPAKLFTLEIPGDTLAPAVGLVLLVWKRTHGLPDADVLAMFWTAFAASRLYRLTQRRNTSDVVTLLISLAFLIWNLVQFFQITG